MAICSKRCTQLVVETFEPGLALELIETYKVQALVGVPTMLIGMLEHPEFSKRDISSIHTMTSGGSTVPAALVQRFEEDGWLHTGDLCSMDERGYCKVEGRLKDMIIRGGENIYSRELEELLFRHPTVGEVAIVGLPGDRYGEIVGAFIRAAPGARPDREELFAYLREHLSPQKTPKNWFLIEDFPLTGSGKIQKFVLRQQWQDGQFTEMS